MNQRYKQWKKWLAEPKLLVGLATFVFITTSVAFNVIYHLLAFFMDSMKGASVLSYGQNLSYFGYQVKHHLFSLFFPYWSKRSYWLLYLLLLVVVGILLAILSYKARRSYRDLNKGTKGTSKWTTLEEIKRQYPKASIAKDVEFDSPPGLPIAVDPNRQEIYFDPANTNSKVMGGTQTGKTQYITYPTIDLNIRSKQPDSMVINDIKGDITRRTWEHPLARKKFNRLTFNLVNPKNSLRYNPLHEVIKYWVSDNDRAQEAIKTVSTVLFDDPDAKDPIWNLGAKSVFETAVVLVCEIAVKESKPEWVNIPSVSDFIDLTTQPKDLNKKGEYLLDRYVEGLSRNHVARKFYRQAKRGTEQQRKSFMMIFDGKLSFLTTSSMIHLTSGNDIDFSELVYPSDGKPTLLFVVFPYADEANAIMLSLFYNQLYQTIAKTSTEKGKKYDFRLQSIFEEFPNIPPIMNLKKHLNVGLEAGNIIRIYSQSYQQVYENYGDTLGKVILQASGNSIFIQSDDKDDAKDFADNLGETTVIVEQRSGSPMDLNKSFTELEDGRELINTYELRKLLESEIILDRTKKRKDLEGRDIRPHPIKASKKQIKKGGGEKEFDEFEDYTNMLGAWEYLFVEAGGDFDDHGKGLNDFNFNVGTVLEDTLVSEEAVQLHIKAPTMSKSDVSQAENKAKSDNIKRKKSDSVQTSNNHVEEPKSVEANFSEVVETQDERRVSPRIEEVYQREKVGKLLTHFFGEGIQLFFKEEVTFVFQLDHLIRQNKVKLSEYELKEFFMLLAQTKK
ncbi:type IV secretory system conjugative DNA transfer family protein [Lactococcus kimchii]|uniref:type IV secretory system conjugative DNA transfer family protein n=1 Tax=Lactococcus sp. S-13 TaxID=2507158 RepID=UPI0016802780|nr:type IV secretory system conjugative DNA transfer family protein [Lactococcus sp. S-13]